MGVLNPTADPANVVQALVYTLLDVFDAARDLHLTLKNKEKRDYEQRLRSKGYPQSRKIEYIEDELNTDESIVLDKAAVTRQFEIGFQDIGTLFAVGDAFSQTGLQSQIITLQSVIITTFLYGPTSPEPISHHLSNVLAACRAAGTTCVDILAAQQQRQLTVKLPYPQLIPSPIVPPIAQNPLPYPATEPSMHAPSTSAHATEHVQSRQESSARQPSEATHSITPSKSQRDTSPQDTHTLTITYPTIDDVASRPKPLRSDTESTSFSGLTSYGAQSPSDTHYCVYARDLQRHPSQPLHTAITSSAAPYCPYCNRTLHLLPGKSWEIFKEDRGDERCFQIQNRFVVKCHREGVDGGYSCILCSRSRASKNHTVCGDVKALIRHIWMDHDAMDLEEDQDVREVVEKRVRGRRDSGMSFTESRGSRRSSSLGPSRSHGRRRYEREVETLEIRSKREN